MKKLSLLILCFAFLNTVSFAQSSELVSSKFSPDQQNRFSNAIKLVQQSSLFGRIASGDALVVMLPPDFGLNNLPANDADLLFSQKNSVAIENFMSRFSVDGHWDFFSINAKLNAASPTLSLTNMKGEKMGFSKNGDLLMVTSQNGYESNIESSIKINNTTFFLLAGMLK